jgi:thiamine biosynthesis protein ThiS
MQVTVNAEARTLPEGATVRKLLDDLALPSTRVAVEVNRQLVRRIAHEAHVLHEGDVIEVVTLVGGG